MRGTRVKPCAKREEVAFTGVKASGSFEFSKKGEDGPVAGEVDFMVKLLRACVWMPWRK